MRHSIRTTLGATLFITALTAGSIAQAAGTADVDCKLRFSLTGWSAVLQHAEGSGIVTCENGQRMAVKISAKGVGLTAGKSRVDNGTGKFTDVRSVEDVLGTYARGEAHAGIVKSGTAQLLTKGTVSLALAGSGEGIDLGIAVGGFTIDRQ